MIALAQKSHGAELAFHFCYGKLLKRDQGWGDFSLFLGAFVFVAGFDKR
jgi:hypothetical protein